MSMDPSDDPLVLVAEALQEVAAGHPVDFGSLRARITAHEDQLEAFGRDFPEIREDVARMAELIRRLRPAVDALEAGDFEAAREALREALKAMGTGGGVRP